MTNANQFIARKSGYNVFAFFCSRCYLEAEIGVPCRLGNYVLKCPDCGALFAVQPASGNVCLSEARGSLTSSSGLTEQKLRIT